MDYKIVKPNNLIQARQRYSATQHRAIVLAIMQIKPDDEELKDYKIRISDVSGAPSVREHSADYAKVRAEVEKLTETAIKIEDENEWHSYAFVSHAWGEKGKDYINIRFSPEVRGILLGVKRNYTSYVFQNVSKFKGSYSLRIYELCKQYQKIGHRRFDLDRLRYILSLEDKYPNFAHFRSRVLLVAQNEINTSSDIHIDFTAEKEGRRVVAIDFKIVRQTLDGHALLSGGLLSVSNLESLSILEQWGLSAEKEQELISSYGEDYVQEKVAIVGAYAKRKPGGHNMAGLLLRACQGDWHDAAIEEQRRAQKEQEKVDAAYSLRADHYAALVLQVSKEQSTEYLEERCSAPKTYGPFGNIWQDALEKRRASEELVSVSIEDALVLS